MKILEIVMKVRLLKNRWNTSKILKMNKYLETISRTLQIYEEFSWKVQVQPQDSFTESI